MKLLAKKVHRFLVSEDGPTAVEYAVMLALIIIVCLAAIHHCKISFKTGNFCNQFFQGILLRYHSIIQITHKVLHID